MCFFNIYREPLSFRYQEAIKKPSQAETLDAITSRTGCIPQGGKMVVETKWGGEVVSLDNVQFVVSWDM